MRFDRDLSKPEEDGEFSRMMKLCEIEKLFEWGKWTPEIPHLEFPAGWQVKAIPPRMCGIVRYNLRHNDIENSFVSVYLDCYGIMGCVDHPYWEVYPVDGDCARCAMPDTEALIGYIAKSFEQQRKS